jgi:tetratricopeptide (TPR) repeat protein
MDKRTISWTKKKSGDRKRVPRKPTTGWRLWLFRIVALTVIPGLLFLCLELSLRIAGYGFPPSATIKCEVDGRDSYRDNVKFGWRFFPRNIAREFDPFILPSDKPEDAYRVLVLGASAAQGVPDGAFSFGRVLQAMLQEAYPGTNFEVITAAMAAINSHVVLEIADDCVRHQIDLFIVYLGNNEVVGPYGPGSVFASLSPHLFLIRAGITLKATRLGQLLTSLLESMGPRKNNPKVWRGMEMFLEKQVRAEDRRLETVYRHFERNLKDIGRIAGRSGAKTIFCTVGSNLKDSPPFASLHRPGITEAQRQEWNNIYEQGVAYEKTARYAEAAAHYLASAEIDDCYANLQYRLGCCYWAMGEYDKALERYVRARELDTLRFRADIRINEIIRAVASDKAADDVYLVDVVKAFEKNSPHEVAGEELFYEHVHLNFKGNYLLAKTVFEQVEKILPGQIKSQRAKERSLFSETECAQRLAYTEVDQYRIAHRVLNTYIKKAPFTNQLNHEERIRQLEEQLTALKANLAPEVIEKAATEFRLAIQKDPEDWWLRWRYAELLAGDLKDDRAALEQCRLVLDHLPHFHIAHAQLGKLLSDTGQLDAAIAHYREAIRIKPTNANAHYNLGLAYQRQNKFDRAVEHYSKAVWFQPNHEGANTNLGTVLYQQGEADRAVEIYRKALLVAPDAVDMRFNLGILLEKQGHTAEAIKELEAALWIDPNSVEIHRALEAFQERQNRRD